MASLRSLVCTLNITKTYLYNFDPLKPHFYIVKLGFTGVYIIFLISSKKHRLWVLVRTASPICFEQKYEKYQNFLSENFPFLVVKFSIYLKRQVFLIGLIQKKVWRVFFWQCKLYHLFGHYQYSGFHLIMSILFNILWSNIPNDIHRRNKACPKYTNAPALCSLPICQQHLDA